MQIIIRDELFIKQMIRAYERGLLRGYGGDWSSRGLNAADIISLKGDDIIEHFPAGVVNDDYSNLLEAITYSPCDREGNNYRINCYTFLAQHMSGAPFIRRVIHDSDNNRLAHNLYLSNTLSEIIKSYMRCEIRGDLVIHKTFANNNGFEKAWWPIIRNRRTKTECWFITGHTGWLDSLGEFCSLERLSTLLLRWSKRTQKQWLYHHGKISGRLITSISDADEFNILLKRAYWVQALREHYNSILWSTIIESNSPRAGVCYYLDGRAYCVQYGENTMNFNIIRASRRQFEIFPLKPWVQSDRSFRQNYASSDDPDFVQRYGLYRRGEEPGVFERGEPTHTANDLLQGQYIEGD